MIALLSVLAAGAGCGGCVDEDNQTPPPAQGPMKLPSEYGNLKRIERPLPHFNVVGSDAAAGADD